MKKALLVGCGVMLLVIVSIGGFLGWVMWEPMMDLTGQTEATVTRLVALDQEHPFEPLEAGADGFEEHLELRVEIQRILSRLNEELASTIEDEELPIIDRIRASIVQPTPALAELEDAFVRRGVGPTQYSYHSRLLWAALRELDKGGGSPALAGLRDRYSHLQNIYDATRQRDKDVPALDDIIGAESEWSPDVIDAAMNSLALDVERVVEGVGMLALEPMWMQVGASPELVGVIAFPVAVDQSSVRVGR